MGEYTENLQLYKADTVEDGNDTFNIDKMLNENWDKIDEKLKKLPVQNGGLYINDDTTEDDRKEVTKALKNLSALVQSGENAYVNPTKDLNNFQTGIGLFNETILNIPPDDIWWCILSTGAILINTVVQIAFSLNKKNIKFRSMISGVWEDWSDFRFVPLDGSVPMSGTTLKLYNGTGEIASDSNTMMMSAVKQQDDHHTRVLSVENEKHVPDVAKAVKFTVIGVADYNIFGEHNTELLASTIQSLIDSGVIEVGGFKSPIKIQRGSAGTTEVTGTGKGKLFFNGDYHSDLTLVVDGLTLVSNVENPIIEHNAEVEFTKSFSIKSSSDTYLIKYTAVFY